MTRKLWILSALVVSWLTGGCVTQSYAPSTDAATQELRIKAGDRIRVVTTRRERVSFEVTEVRGDRFVGVAVEPWSKELRRAGEPVDVPFDELAIVEVTRFSPGAAAVVVLLVGGVVAAVAAVPAAGLPATIPMAP
jgi:hypothetical protein